MSAVIEVDRLTKSYGESRGIVDLTFDVTAGEAFGFLGPNGAGKTTAIRTLLGFLRPSSGRATVLGRDCWRQSTEIKRDIGYLPGEFSLYPELTGSQILTYLANLRGGVDTTFVASLADRLQLDLSKRFRDYSRGNKQKVGLIQALMHRPRLLILDEPTSGLDPLNQQEFYRTLSEAIGEGATVLLSSHNLPEVEITCSRVGIIREGRLVQLAAVQALKDMQHHELDLVFPHAVHLEWFNSLPGVVETRPSTDPHRVILVVRGTVTPVLEVAVQHDLAGIETRQPTLEEIFLRYYSAETEAQPAGVA